MKRRRGRVSEALADLEKVKQIKEDWKKGISIPTIMKKFNMSRYGIEQIVNEQ